MSRDIDDVLISSHQSHTHNHNTIVKEYRAPTDDSIRMYDELKQKAIDSVVYRDTINATLYEANISIAFDCEKDKHILYYALKLNDVLVKDKFYLDIKYIKDKSFIGKMIFDKFIESLARSLTIDTFNNNVVFRELMK